MTATSSVMRRPSMCRYASTIVLRRPEKTAIVLDRWQRDPRSPHDCAADGRRDDCGQNRVTGARLSEHGKANALDIRSLKLADGKVVRLTDVAVARAFRERIRRSACARFMTVLGPGSDGYHEEHVHVDLAERHG